MFQARAQNSISVSHVGGKTPVVTPSSTIFQGPHKLELEGELRLEARHTDVQRTCRKGCAHHCVTRHLPSPLGGAACFWFYTQGSKWPTNNSTSCAAFSFLWPWEHVCSPPPDSPSLLASCDLAASERGGLSLQAAWLSSQLPVSPVVACPLSAEGRKEGQKFHRQRPESASGSLTVRFPSLQCFLGNQVNSHSTLSTLQLLINAYSVLNSLLYLKRNYASCSFGCCFFFF